MKKLFILILIVIGFSHCTKDEPVNNPPKIQAINISPTKTTPGTSVQVNAIVTDADGDQLSYTWTPKIGNVSDMNSSSIIWEIPVSIETEKYYSIDLTVSDGKETASLSKSIRVQEGLIISGSIFYKDTKIPVSGVNVTIGNISTISNEVGYYELKNVAEGQQNIKLSKSGFDDNMISENISSTNRTFDLYMTTAEYTKKVYGYVQAGDKTKVSNIKVTLLNPDGSDSNISTVSDASGYFQLITVPTGQRKIKLRNQNNSIEIAGYELEKEIYLASIDYSFNPRVYIRRTAVIDILNSNSWDNISHDLYELTANGLILKPGCTLNISYHDDMPNDFLPTSDYNSDGTIFFKLRGTTDKDAVGEIDFYADNEKVYWTHSVGISSYRVYYISGSNWERYKGKQPKYVFHNDLKINWLIKGVDFDYYY